MQQNLNKTGIYVHIPFCYKKCNYCDFYSLSDYGIAGEYFNALTKNIRLAGERYGRRTVDSIFFGGGTPSSVECEYVASAIEYLHKYFDITPDCEITLEANPATVDRHKLSVYNSCGINRISMGVQSASDSELDLLSRLHSYNGFEKSFFLCRDMGFDNINLDVMMGIPDQSMKSLAYTLEKLTALAPEHISVYMLSIEEGTPFYQVADRLNLPSEDEVCSMYLGCHDLLEARGYSHYEISNFAKEGRECRHNLKYWQGDDYISFGPAAHSFVDGVRYSYIRDINKYINSTDFTDVLGDVYTVDEAERQEDKIIFGLRLSKGIKLASLDGYDSRGRLDNYVKNGYAKIEGDRLCLTPMGMLISNSIISDLLI